MLTAANAFDNDGRLLGPQAAGGTTAAVAPDDMS
jgi:hypothetical protein